MEAVKIVLVSIIAAVVYGILHDQITARVCIEYFTIGHPDLFGTESPTLLGLGWGVVATWWAGLFVGLPLAFAARFGSRPKRSATSLLRPVAILLGVMAACAFVAGVLGFVLASSGRIELIGLIAHRVPREKHVWFLADFWAHNASYLSGFVGGVVLALHVWWSRTPQRRLPTSTPAATTIGIAVVEFKGRYLIGTRGPEVSLAGYAEFPGGKCLANELPEDCAVRECVEETGLAVTAERLLLRREFTYPHATVDLHFFLCHPECAASVRDDHRGFRWIPKEELLALRFPEANAPLISLLTD
jgi:mutator protein MutT